MLKYLSLRNLSVLYLLVFMLVGIQKYLLGGYNNYLMFTMPFGWMLQGKTLYEWRTFLFDDLYKYSPTFAFLMGPFYYIKHIGVGVTLWNLLNTTVLLVGIFRYLRFDAPPTKQAVLLIVFLEALITAQNIQSNNLILGFMLLGVALMRDEQPFWAALCLALAAYFKVYGAAVAILFVFYPQKIKFLASMAFWVLILALLPLTVMPFDKLLAENLRWLQVASESKLGQQVSVMGIMESWFQIKVNYTIVEALALVLFLLPLTQVKKWKNAYFQRLMLAYLLVFVIVFNPMAESPTYIYAVMGAALWWISQEKINTFHVVLLGVIIIFCSLSPSDLFPRNLRDTFFVPYNIKAVPMVVLWGVLLRKVWGQVM